MNTHRKVFVLFVVFIAGVFLVTPVMARRFDTSLIAYDRWITEDYRLQTWDIPEDVSITDPEYVIGAEEIEQPSELGKFEPINAIFGVFGWIGKSVGSLFGVQTNDPYEANSSP